MLSFSGNNHTFVQISYDENKPDGKALERPVNGHSFSFKNNMGEIQTFHRFIDIVYSTVNGLVEFKRNNINLLAAEELSGLW